MNIFRIISEFSSDLDNSFLPEERRKMRYDSFLESEFKKFCADYWDDAPTVERQKLRWNAATLHGRKYQLPYSSSFPLRTDFLLPTSIEEAREFFFLSRYKWWYSLPHSVRNASLIPITPNYYVTVNKIYIQGVRSDEFTLSPADLPFAGALQCVIFQWCEEDGGEEGIREVLEQSPKWQELLTQVRQFGYSKELMGRITPKLVPLVVDGMSDRFVIRFLAGSHFPTTPSVCRYVKYRALGIKPGDCPPPYRGLLVQSFAYASNDMLMSADGDFHVIQQVTIEGAWCPAHFQPQANAMATRHRDWLKQQSSLAISGDLRGGSSLSPQKEEFIAVYQSGEPTQERYDRLRKSFWELEKSDYKELTKKERYDNDTDDKGKSYRTKCYDSLRNLLNHRHIPYPKRGQK
jgi:hypothetical protein